MKLTSCETVRQYLLSAGWDAEQRRHAGEVLEHAGQCPKCQSALEDFDRIASTLASAEPAEPAGGWEAMRQRMEDALKALPPGPVKKSLAGARLQLIRPSLAVAAAIAVIAAATFEIGRMFAPEVQWPSSMAVRVIRGDSPPDQTGSATISPNDVTREVAEFRQVLDTRAGQTGWMVVSNTSNTPQVGPSTDAAPAGKRVLLLRLDLWQGGALVSGADLVVRAGQSADLTVPMSTGQLLHYRIGTTVRGAGDPARLSVLLELKSPQDKSPLAALATTLQLNPGQAVTAGALATTAGAYQLKIELKEADLASDGR